MAVIRTVPLDERITNVRADIDAFIDARVTEIKKTCEGVPEAMIRRTITHGIGCQCAAYLDLKRQDDAEATRRAKDAAEAAQGAAA